MNRKDDWLRTEVPGLIADNMTIARYHIPADMVVAPDTDGLLDGTAFPAAAGSVTTFLKEMPYAMNVTAVASGTQTGKIKVWGTDMAGKEISEELTMTSATPVVGAKAFATVTKVDLPQKVASETIDLGWGGLFGLPYSLATDELVIIKLFDGAADAGTVAVDPDELAGNTFDPAGTPNGEKAIDLYIVI